MRPPYLHRNELAIALDVDDLHPRGERGLESFNEAEVFCDVVGGGATPTLAAEERLAWTVGGDRGGSQGGRERKRWEGREREGNEGVNGGERDAPEGEVRTAP